MQKTGADGIDWGLKTIDTARSNALEKKKFTEDAGMEVMGFLNTGKMWQEYEMHRAITALRAV
ncbi:MAG TPA: hypothetical protein PK821_04025 [Victivallales bacterium]|nr:hypothetical protein [Victivallales bacterium]